MNMIQHELDDMADIFGVKGLNKLSKIQLPRHDMIALARYLEELKMYVSHHRQLDTEIAKLSINLFIYESGPNDEKIEDVLFMQIQILNLE
jgi:hypothetical protein